MRHLIQVRRLLVGVTVALAVSACVKDNTGPAGGTPPVKDVAFVGYSTATTQQMTCGNCHVLTQTAGHRGFAVEVISAPRNDHSVSL